MTHGKVVAAVEHTTISVATAVDHVAVALSGRDEHARTMEFFGDERLGRLRSEVAKEHDEGVAACLAYLFDGFEHVLLVLYCCLAVIYLALISLHDVLATLCGKSDRETVTADGNDAELHLRNVVALHNLFCLDKFGVISCCLYCLLIACSLFGDKDTLFLCNYKEMI